MSFRRPTGPICRALLAALLSLATGSAVDAQSVPGTAPGPGTAVTPNMTPVTPTATSGLASPASAAQIVGSGGSAAGGPLIVQAVSADYRVGPGDGLLLGVWGQTYASYPLVVMPEGKVIVPNVGEAQIDGLSLSDARDVLDRLIRRTYREVRVTLSLSSLRTYKVTVAGEVRAAGSVIVSAVDRASDALGRAGGLTDRASIRQVELRLPDGTRRSLDLFRYYALGDLSTNPSLPAGAVLYVPAVQRTVLVSGEVTFPGTYEFVAGDSLSTLLRLARGFRDEALRDSVTLIRFAPDGVTATRQTLDLRSGTPTAMALEPGDQLYVPRRTDFRRVRAVIVEGETKRTGMFAIEPGTTRLSDVLRQAEGLTDDAALEEATLTRTVGTLRPDPTYERLRLTPRADMTNDEYEYLKMKSRERNGQMVVDFKRLLAGDREQDLLLKDGDVIRIPRAKNYITVSGQVVAEGNLPYRADWRVSDYIRETGGFGWRARTGDVRVIRARTGEWVEADQIDQLEPGDRIWVPEKRHIAWGQVIQISTLVLSQVVTVYFILTSLTK